MNAGAGPFCRARRRLINDINPTDATSNERKRRFIMLVVLGLGPEAKWLFKDEKTSKDIKRPSDETQTREQRLYQNLSMQNITGLCR